MDGESRVLVIGPPELGAAIARLRKSARVETTETALAGVWQAGRMRYDYVLVSLALGCRALRTVACVRELDPDVKILVSTLPANEPLARQALALGADDYLLEPLSEAELLRTLSARNEAQDDIVVEKARPTIQEFADLSAVLRGLCDGPQATLDRLAEVVRRACDARGARLELDLLSSETGTLDGATVECPILRRDERVGRIVVALRTDHDASDRWILTRLGDYARLVEAYLSQACEQHRWRELAWTDDVTGLRNRRFLDRALDDMIERAASQHHELTVLLFDIDDFKGYNDRFGHDVGDALLVEMGTLLTSCTREHDVVARYGGDEFAVVFFDTEGPRVAGSTPLTKPADLAERFSRSIRQHDFRCLGPDAPGRVTISGGVASFPWDGATRELLLRAADAALLCAKRSGKNRIDLAAGAHGRRD